jgi:hypothetical protein
MIDPATTHSHERCIISPLIVAGRYQTDPILPVRWRAAKLHVSHGRENGWSILAISRHLRAQMDRRKTQRLLSVARGMRVEAAETMPKGVNPGSFAERP